ncbi:hypothetical protein V8F20_001908 [Naviculisporaceae sp. PSN 640]
MLVTRNLRLVARRHRWGSRQVAVTYKATTRPSSSSFSTSSLSSGHGAPSQPRSRDAADFNLQCHRGYATARKEKPTHIAILGGGLTGLATAYYITRYFPSAKITIYEKSKRLGGWVDTERVAVKTPDGREGFVNFERGARMVKAPMAGSWKNLDGLLFWDLVYSLELQDKYRAAPRATDVGSYIYYPDHLVRVSPPSRFLFFRHPISYLRQIGQLIIGLFTEPVFKDSFSSLLHYWLSRNARKKGTLPNKEVDVSTGDFLAERMGSRSLVDNVGSALIHGIYGGDIWKLSVDSSPLRWRLRPKQRQLKQLAKAELPKAKREKLTFFREPDLELLFSLAAEHSRGIFQWCRHKSYKGQHPAWVWFQDGFSTLIDAVAAELRKNPNVTIKLNQNITSLDYHASDAVALTSATDKKTVLYDKVISTLFAGSLSPLINQGDRCPAPTLKEIKAVSIQLVNLWYPTPGLNHPFRGFGYLIPQTVPWEQNPEGALGVLFDSDREAYFDQSLSGSGQHTGTSDTVPGTKFTVMLGGHLMGENELPTGQQAIDMAKSVLERHLGIPPEESAQAVGSTKTCRNCIPQHFVGHRMRMAELDSELQQAFRGKLAVIGGSYQLPGVLPSLRAAWDIAKEVSPDKTSPTVFADRWSKLKTLDEFWDIVMKTSKPVLPTGLGRAISDPGDMLRPLKYSNRRVLADFLRTAINREAFDRQKTPGVIEENKFLEK